MFSLKSQFGRRCPRIFSVRDVIVCAIFRSLRGHVNLKRTQVASTCRLTRANMIESLCKICVGCDATTMGMPEVRRLEICVWVGIRDFFSFEFCPLLRVCFFLRRKYKTIIVIPLTPISVMDVALFLFSKPRCVFHCSGNGRWRSNPPAAL